MREMLSAGGRPPTERTIASVDDVHSAIDHYVTNIPVERVLSMATHMSGDIEYRSIRESQMADALANRDGAGLRERDTYASYVNEAFLTALEKTHGGRVVFQFSFGAEPLPFETASRLGQQTIAQVGEMISRHPGIRFQCFPASRHANQSLCTLCRELPNLSLAGYWWHNFFPSAMRQVMEERLDMLPANKQVGVFSEAYCVEWAYAKLVMVRSQLAIVLAQKIEQGQYSQVDALQIAKSVLFHSPRETLGMEPAWE